MPSALVRLSVSILASAALIALWEYASTSGMVNRVLLPAPSVVLPRMLGIISSGQFFAPLVHTMSLLGLGFATAAFFGIGLGMMMGTSPFVYRLFDPLVESIRPIPKAALVAPLFLLLGVGYNTMLVITALAQFFPILINTVQGARGVDRVLVNTARTFRLSRARTVFTVIMPASLPMIFAGLRTAIGIGLVMAITAEMLAGDAGIGFLVLDYERSFETVAMFAWVAILAIVGLVLAYGFDWIERAALPWRSK